MKKKIITCVGTRPNFIKVTQLDHYFKKHKFIDHILVHTGQHFDAQMSDVFFSELKIPLPKINFNITASTQINTITQIMLEFEKVLIAVKPDLILVPGDVNSSFACAFVANRLGIPVGHIESGLRSFDQTMPEEINRILIDDLSSLYFVTEKSGKENLIKEGKQESKIKFTGNTMIDSLVKFLPLINESKILSEYNLTKDNFISVTFHRPNNVDDKDNLLKIIEILHVLNKFKQVVFPIHPRTKKQLQLFGLMDEINKTKTILIPPLGYLDFIQLIKNSFVTITDSGGIQEETTFLGVPCLTIRANTERPVTIMEGTNTLVNLDANEIQNHLKSIQNGTYKKGQLPKFWDGNSSERIVNHIIDYLIK